MGEERYMNGAIRRALAGRIRPEVGPCPDLNLTAAYLEGALSGEERADIEAHAAGCSSCRSLLALSIVISDEERKKAESPAPPLTERRVLFRFSIPVSALALLLLTAGLAAFLAWNQFAKRPESTELAEMRDRQAPAQATPESGLPGSPSVSRMEAPTTAAQAPDKGEMSTTTKPGGRRLEQPAEALRAPAAPAYELERDESAGKKAETAYAADMDLKSGENEAVPGAPAASPKAEAKTVGGVPGGVVGGIMAPRPVEEAASRISEPAALQVTGRAGREAGEVMAPAKDDLALRKEKALGERSDAAPVPLQTRENPREVLRQLAGAGKDSGAADSARARSDRSFAAAVVMKDGTVTGSRHLISGRTFELHSGYWIDLECVKYLDSELAEYAAGAPESEETRKVMPGLDELRRTGIPVILHWKGKNIVLQ